MSSVAPVPSLIVLAVIGAVLGPTLNHLAVRAGNRSPFQGAVPRCETCGTTRRLWAMRCPQGHSTRRREPWVWAASAGFFAASWAAADGSWWLVPAYATLAALTVVLGLTDLDHKLIPNRVLYPGTAVAFVLLAVGAAAAGRTGDLPRAAVGAAGYFAVLFAVYLVARGGFGFGDVKLAVLLGGMTAFASQRSILLAVFFTGVFGGIPAIALLVSRRGGLRTELPYGPPMLLGAWTALVVGETFGRIITG